MITDTKTILISSIPTETTELVFKAYEMLKATLENGGNIYVAGCGGSASDSEHFSGELIKGFNLKRPLSEKFKKEYRELVGNDDLIDKLQGGLPVYPLVSNAALITAVVNDIAGEAIFAQQLLAYMKSNDCFIAISTSGNSKTLVYGAKIAKTLGGKVIALTGREDCALSNFSDVTIASGGKDTPAIQEKHIKIYHALAAALENDFYGE